MNHERGHLSLPAPVLVDTGTVINKTDMLRLLQDLGRVRYIHFQDQQVIGEGEGYVMEVFSDQQQASLVANNTLYLNVNSFDYLEMGRLTSQETHFDLVQDPRRLRLVPLSNPLKDQNRRNINAATLEAMVAEALSASWDACMDDDHNFPEP